MKSEAVPLLILGGTGRIGSVLRSQEAELSRAGLRPIWQSRRQRAGFISWDILTEPCPKDVAGGVVLCLAGVIRGDLEELALNEALALAACRAAAEQGAGHVFLASSAAVYAPSSMALAETVATVPPGDYGSAKLAMERAVLDWADEGTPGVTILRIGNIAGLDALLGGVRPGHPVRLDPISGQEGGPVRSYIGPTTLAVVLARLMEMAAAGKALPRVLNIAAAPAVSMADLLDAAGVDWAFGDPNPAAIPRVELDIGVLRGFSEMPPLDGSAADMVAEWRGLAK